MEDNKINSNECSYYIFRINYDELKSVIIEEINSRVLRQGWGLFGMDIRNSFEDYEKVWSDNWGGDDLLGKKRKYNNLRIMLEFKKGDIIVLPKVPEARTFTICEVTDVYYFDDGTLKSSRGTDDFRHCIPIKVIYTGIDYDFNNDTLIISKSFRAYQSAINRVYKEEVQNSIDSLIKTINSGSIDQQEKSNNYLSILKDEQDQKMLRFLQDVVNTITAWSPHDFEKLIDELFDRAGYMKLDQHVYDGNGGDIDRVYACKFGSLVDDIIAISGDGINDKIPRIHVQAKLKKDTDANPMEGIEQLIKMKIDGIATLDIVINTTNKYSLDAIQRALDNGIILLDGIQFAKLLVRYGILGG